MNFCKTQQRVRTMLFASLLSAMLSSVQAADKALLDVLMENGVITQEQADQIQIDRFEN